MKKEAASVAAKKPNCRETNHSKIRVNIGSEAFTLRKVKKDKGFKVESATFGQVMYWVIIKSCSNKSPLSCNRLIATCIWITLSFRS